NMSGPVVDINFRTYRLKRKKDPFFAKTAAQLWSFQKFYSFMIYSADAPKTFNEILSTWTVNLKNIQKSRNIPKSITNFARDLVKFNGTEEFEKIRRACEQNFQAHLLATLSSGSVTKTEMAQGYMKQANEILTGTAGERIKENEEVDELNVQISQNFDAILVWLTLSA
ncbi:9259_t:CDS:1, partial [Gigaspora rosea]